MTNKTKNYDKVDIKKLKNSQVEITGSILPETWEAYRSAALKNINDNITLDGFRKGMIPENVLLAKVGEMAVLEEMAELALSPAYLDIILDHKIDAIGRPSIQVTKLAKGNSLEFKIVSSVVPEVTLPDYKAISVETVKKQDPEALKVTDKDMEETIKRIRMNASPKKHDHGHDHGEHEHGEHGHEHEGHNHEHGHEEKIDEKDLPELNDDFVKKLGEFENVEDFKSKLKLMIEDDKKMRAEERLRISLADSISEKTSVEIPELLIESETSRIEAQFNDDMARMGVKLEDYLKHSKKTIEDLRKEWRPHAEKKAKLQLVLNAIATKENIRPSAEEIEREVAHIVEHYKDADREKAAAYAETVLTNEKVFQFLEGQK